MVIGQSNSTCLTDIIFLNTLSHSVNIQCSMNSDVTCIILLLLYTLNKKVSQIYFFQVLYTVLSSIDNTITNHKFHL